MKSFVSVILLATTAIVAHATTHVVTCQNGANHFLPINVNAVVGDTIHWTWVSGTHIVGIINTADIPSGAAQWNAPIDLLNHDFEYVVTVPGEYHYACHPDNPHDENGYITVTEATLVRGPDADPVLFNVHPNPFSAVITIEAVADANGITISDLLGRVVGTYSLRSGQGVLQIDLATLPKGIFFCSVARDGVVVATQRIIKD